MGIDEKGAYYPTRLKVGDKTRIEKVNLSGHVDAEAVIGKYYDGQLPYDPRLLRPNDGDDNNRCTVRVDEIDGDECICTVTEVYKENQ